MGGSFPSNPVTLALLWPLSSLYAAAMAVRNLLYDRDVLKTHRLGAPVISVGNLSVGGTGKTPVVDAILRLLGGRRTGVLTRGYGRKDTGKPVLLLLASGKSAPVSEAGDEPLLLAKKHPASAISVQGDRVAGGRLLMAGFQPEVIVLDDGFQHRRLHRDLNLVLLDGPEPLGNGLTLPGGPLREWPGGLRRADAIIFKGEFPGEEEMERLRPWIRPEVPLFRGRWERMRPVPIAEWPGEPASGPASGTAFLAFCGLARPDSFLATLRRSGLRVLEARGFRDHEPYSTRNLEELARVATTIGATAMITTGKDAVKVQELPDHPLPIWVLDGELVIADRYGSADTFPRFLEDFLARVQT